MIEALMLSRLKRWLTTVPGIRRVEELNPTQPAEMRDTPVAVVWPVTITPGETDDARLLEVAIDVHLGPDYWVATNPMSAMLDLVRHTLNVLLGHRSLDDPDAPGTGGLTYRGANSSMQSVQMMQMEDGTAIQGYTIRWAYTYQDTGVID